MVLLQRIDEKQIVHQDLFGEGANRIEEEIKRLIDIIMKDSPNSVDYDFFDIKGTILLYGVPGIGKTSVLKNCISYALNEHDVDCYELLTTRIIESELGKATINLFDSLNEFEKKKKGILFIDELDKLCTNRKADELSELKRMVIEMMQFIDRLKASNYKMILCSTNVIDQIDEALKRRFSICEELVKPKYEDLIDFANICMKKADMDGSIKGVPQTIKTFDDIKKAFRKIILSKMDYKELFSVED